jgi:hypothetical protein
MVLAVMLMCDLGLWAASGGEVCACQCDGECVELC